ncbi:MAG: hypothetical protein ACLQIB_31590 [Isosphaeraceae bacterium]
MSATRIARMQKRVLLAAGISVFATCLAGCGGSSQEMQLPDEARKIVDRRKVDVEQRPKQSKSSIGRPNGRSSQRRP